MDHPIPSNSFPKGHPNRRALHKADITGQKVCCYCRREFTPGIPPTEDHIEPVSRGGRRSDGIVLACKKCNGCRGSAPFADYLAACEKVHHEVSQGIRNKYKHPKALILDGQFVFVVD